MSTAHSPIAPTTDAPDAAPHGDSDADGTGIRELLAALTDPEGFDLRIVAISGHRTPDPVMYELPLRSNLADELKRACAQGAVEAAGAELRPHHPGQEPAAQQWLYSPLTDGGLSPLDGAVSTQSVRQYTRADRFGQQNVLAFLLSDRNGNPVGRMYQSFSREKALQRSRVVGVWTGEAFTAVTEPLVIDRVLRVIVVGEWVVMRNARAFESMFGALPGLVETAARTIDVTLDRLDVVGGAELRQACLADSRMMHKLASIQEKLGMPGYPEALSMPRLVEFLADNPHLQIPLDRSGPEPRLIFDPAPQHRWQLLKLLDDDYLRSELTELRYEASSKTRIA